MLNAYVSVMNENDDVYILWATDDDRLGGTGCGNITSAGVLV